MPSTKEIRARIRSVGNISKVTNAMQLIAASKMQRAQNAVRNGRDYADKMQSVLSDLVARNPGNEEGSDITPLLAQREVERVMVLLVTPDRGLAGALVGNVTRAMGIFVKDSDVPVSVIAVGRKGERFVSRISEDLMATFSVNDRPRLDDTVSISRFIVNAYEDGTVDKVVMIYAQFINTAVQRPTIKQILPVEPPAEGEAAGTDYIYEPSSEAVLNTLLPRYIETQVYHTILEAIASEHSARMVAMQNATENAKELIEDLTLDLNKARQNQITGELLDIVGGVAAVEG